MNDYRLQHIETYGHGTPERNHLDCTKKVTILDNDGFYDVYECDSDDEAHSIAQWYLNSVYTKIDPDCVNITKKDNRFYLITYY